MDAGTAAAQPSGKMAWAGRIISGIVVLFLLFTTVMGLMHRAESVKHFVAYGYPESAFLPISIVLAVCALLYAIPRTSILGAMLLTGYLGGATATHARAGGPSRFPIVVGAVAWRRL